MDKSFVISAAAVTHIGIVRSRNEDNLYFNGTVLPEEGEEKAFMSMSTSDITDPCVFAVCDGMGGLNDGGLASYTCAMTFNECEQVLSECPDGQKCLLEIINKANSSLCDIILEKGKRMGSTLAAVAFAGGQMTAANVGDTRIYRMRKKKLHKLSVDHNEAGYLLDNGMITPKQAKDHPGRNCLTQHIGIFSEELVLYPNCVNFDDCKVGDVYIICSDGLYSLIEEQKIISVINENKNLEDAAKILSEEAVKNGGKDNITAILIKITEIKEEEASETEKENAPKPSEINVKNYIKKLLDIRKKGQKPYPPTPRLVMSRLIFAIMVLSAVLGVGMHFLGEKIF